MSFLLRHLTHHSLNFYREEVQKWHYDTGRIWLAYVELQQYNCNLKQICKRRLLGRPIPINFLFFLFYQSTELGSHAVDGHQMYFWLSVVGKAPNNWYRNLAHPSPNFHGWRVKNAKFVVVYNITQIWAACVWKCSKISERRYKVLL